MGQMRKVNKVIDRQILMNSETQMITLKRLFFALIGFGVFMAFLQEWRSPKTKHDDGKQSFSHLVISCQVDWGMLFKSKLKDPRSFEWGSIEDSEVGI